MGTPEIRGFQPGEDLPIVRFDNPERHTRSVSDASAASLPDMTALERILGLDREAPPVCDCIHCECGR